MKKDNQLSREEIIELRFEEAKYDTLMRRNPALARYEAGKELLTLTKKNHERIETAKAIAEETKAREIADLRTRLEEAEKKLKKDVTE